MYLILKNAHIVLAGLSIGGFLLRGVLHARESSMLQNRTAKVLP